MNKKLKKTVAIFTTVLLLTAFACSIHEDSLNDIHGMHSGKSRSRVITGSDVNPFKALLLREIQRSTSTVLLRETDSSIVSPSFGMVDYSEIFEVIDSLDVKNYTFRILNHPNDNFNIFHNMVLTEKEGAFEITLMRYEMTNDFALIYRRDPSVETLKDFQGKISAISLSPADPCEEIEIIYPSSGSGGGGGGGEPGEPGGGDPGGGGGGGGTPCYEMTVSFLCQCGRSYGSWSSYEGSMCGDGSNPGYNLTIVISYSLSAACRMEGDPCIPDGEIGVMPDTKFLKCVTKEKIAEIFPNASLENAKKLADNIRIYGGYFGINTKEEVCHFIAQVGAETGGLSTLNATEDLNYITAARLVAIYPSKFSLTPQPGKLLPGPYLNNPEGLANVVYCCSYGNNGITGAGWGYRGRGVLQLTWKANYDGYEAYLESIGLGWFYGNADSLANPDGVHSVLSGMWFFKNRVLDNMTIDENTPVKKVTRRVNPKLEKLNARKSFYTLAKEKLNC